MKRARPKSTPITLNDGSDEDIGELIAHGKSDKAAVGMVVPSVAAVVNGSAVIPSSVTRLLSSLFPGVPSSMLSSRLTRPIPLDVARAPRPDVTTLVARTTAKVAAAAARRRTTTRAITTTTTTTSLEVATSPPLVQTATAGFFALAAALLPRVTTAVNTAVSSSSITSMVLAPPPISRHILRLRRDVHGWIEKNVPTQQVWRSNTYAITAARATQLLSSVSSSVGVGGGGVRAPRIGSITATTATASLSDVNDGIRAAARAMKGWENITESSRARKRRGLLPLAPPPPPPPFLPTLPSDINLFTNVLMNAISWIGARVKVENEVHKQTQVNGVITWIGRCHFTLLIKSERGGERYITLPKLTSWLYVQWPTTARPGGKDKELKVHANIIVGKS